MSRYNTKRGKFLNAINGCMTSHTAAVMNSIWIGYLNVYDGHCGYTLVFYRWFV